MRLVCVSDTHNLASGLSLPDGDVLIHSGDFTMRGQVREFEKFASWLGTLSHKHIVVVAGNHDWLAEEHPEDARRILTSARNNIHYLHDQSVDLDGLKVYGSPYQPEFFSWAFNLPRGPILADKWAEIPEDAEVVVTHGPPMLIGDQVHREGTLAIENVGCSDLAARLRKLPKLKAHICGHIHPGHGLREINGVKYVNASVLNDQYLLVNSPIVIDV